MWKVLYLPMSCYCLISPNAYRKEKNRRLNTRLHGPLKRKQISLAVSDFIYSIIVPLDLVTIQHLKEHNYVEAEFTTKEIGEYYLNDLFDYPSTTEYYKLFREMFEIVEIKI